jgi:hypothetical protein
MRRPLRVRDGHAEICGMVVAAAAAAFVTESTDAFTNSPAAFCTSRTGFVLQRVNELDVADRPGVCVTSPETPSLPLPPTPQATSRTCRRQPLI